MYLPPNGREYYRLAIATDPPITATDWEASFDAGATWHAAEADGATGARWLLAGPNATGNPVGTVVISAPRTKPLIRAIDNPEILVRAAPAIHLSTP